MSKKLILTLFCVLSTLIIFSQRPEPDTFKTKKGDLIVQPILHGTLVMLFNDKIIYVDPYGGANAFAGMAKPDLILITDIHGDHLNEDTLDALEINNTPIIVPQAVADKMSEKYQNLSVRMSMSFCSANRSSKKHQ